VVLYIAIAIYTGVSALLGLFVFILVGNDETETRQFLDSNRHTPETKSWVLVAFVLLWPATLAWPLLVDWVKKWMKTVKEKLRGISPFSPRARADFEWLLQTLEAANQIIVAEGLDDDEEVSDIRERMKEIRKRWRLKS
jgi:hypothetical protein